MAFVESIGDFIDVIESTSVRRKSPIAKLSIQEPVIEMWAKIWRDEESADLTIECLGGGKVRCHYVVVSKISEVLAAMVSSNMQEGLSKRIVLVDVSAEAVRLLLEVCYCGSVAEETAEHDLPTLLSAMDLAHRWHVPFALEFLEKLALGFCREQHFEALAGVVFLQELQELTRRLKDVCRGSEALKGKFRNGEMSLDGQKIGREVWDMEEVPRPLNKKRRTCE